MRVSRGPSRRRATRKTGHNRRPGVSWAWGWLRCIAASMLIVLGSCEEPAPIKIGFVGGITGRVGDLGRAGRDGVTLAIEEANRKGGIGGHRLELLVRDDHQDPEAAREAVRELITSGVVAIIGHMTSSMSIVGAVVADEAGVPMVSPTTSTNALSGKDDFFFRVYPASRFAADRLAAYLVESGILRMAVVYDVANRAHTESWYNAFRESLKSLGGEVVFLDTFESGMSANLGELADAVTASDADGLFIIANGIDTALICQLLEENCSGRSTVVSEWSVTPELLRNGGDAVNGLTFLHTFDFESRDPKYLAFTSAFEDRFGYEPGFAAVHAYDAVQIVLAGLEKGADPVQIKKSILNIGAFDGLQTKFTFDEFGDVRRDLFLMTIKDRKIIQRE